MTDGISEFISRVRSGNRLQSYDEAATKQAVILPLLHILGWDTYDPDEVKPEYVIAGRRVDYALRLNGANKVFLEAKKISEDLDGHRDQLLDYSFREGVSLAILTNGVTWWFYLPLREGSWDQRKFYTVDLLQQELADIALKFDHLLSRTNVANGQAIHHAEQLYTAQQQSVRLATDLPKAWNKIVSEPDGLLVEIINDTLEKMSGFRADDHYIEQFLAESVSQFIVAENAPQQAQSGRFRTMQTPSFRLVRPPSPPVRTNTAGTYAGKTVIGFVFRGRHYQVRTWKELLIAVANLTFEDHRHELDICLQIVGKKRPYFSRNPSDLREPEKIANTGIYVETNLSANDIVKIGRRLVGAFGYEDSDLTVEMR